MWWEDDYIAMQAKAAGVFESFALKKNVHKQLMEDFCWTKQFRSVLVCNKINIPNSSTFCPIIDEEKLRYTLFFIASEVS